MARLIAVLLVVVVVVWLYKEFAYARRKKAFALSRDARGYPMLPPHRRVSDEALAERVRVLRGAVARGELPLEEAAGSLVRFAGGMDVAQARELLRD